VLLIGIDPHAVGTKDEFWNANTVSTLDRTDGMISGEHDVTEVVSVDVLSA